MKIIEEFKETTLLGKLNALSNVASLLGISTLAILQAFLYKDISNFILKTGNFFIALGYIVFLIFCFFVILLSFLSLKKYFIKYKYFITLYYLIIISIFLIGLGLIIIFGYKIIVDAGFNRIL